jgi:hypothetical protein
MYADKTSRNTAHVGTTAHQPPQQDLLLRFHSAALFTG